MACYSPLPAVRSPEGSISFRAYDARGVRRAGEQLALPCGRCIGCRLERTRQWAVRLMHESELHEDSVFLTLTYAPEHMPKGGTLVKEHAQKFMKRLRARIAPVKVRFFLAGEYGEKLGRPHYHVILFGYGFPDKVVLKSDGEFTLYRSELLDNVWGSGNCVIGEVSFESAAYCASYTTKKITGARAKAHYKGRVPEFALMSRKPGIGAGWLEKFAGDVYPDDEVIVRGMSSRPPRYYDKFLELSEPDQFEELRAKRRQIAGALTEAMVCADGETRYFSASDVPERLAVREKVAQAKLKLKKRSLD